MDISVLYIFSENTHQKQPPEMFYKNAVLKNFTIFTGKHLFLSLFLNNVASLRSATL